MPRQLQTTDFNTKEWITVGGAKISGADYQTIKEAVRSLGKNEATGKPMSVSVYLSDFLKSLAADIRAGKRMKKY
jgi:hypothetical protein